MRRVGGQDTALRGTLVPAALCKGAHDLMCGLCRCDIKAVDLLDGLEVQCPGCNRYMWFEVTNLPDDQYQVTARLGHRPASRDCT